MRNYLLKINSALLPETCGKSQILVVEKDSLIVIYTQTKFLLDYFMSDQDQKAYNLNNTDCLSSLTIEASSLNSQKTYYPEKFSDKNIFYTKFNITAEAFGVLKLKFKILVNNNIKDDKQISYLNESSISNLKTTLESSSFYIHVEPKFHLNSNLYSIINIRMQTILSKSLGKIDEWENYFQEASFLGYNFIHFTPIQELGQSESLYCLFNHNQINNYFFENKSLKNTEKLEKLKSTIETAKKKYNLCSAADIVLNHISGNSSWISEHPDAGFNLENSPHLTVAFELEKILNEYNERYENKQVYCRSAPYINSESDIHDIISDLRSEIIKKNFYEYFKLDTNKLAEKVKNYHKGKLKSDTSNNSNNINLTNSDSSNSSINTSGKRKYSHKDEKELIKSLRETVINQGHNKYGTDINVKEFYSLIINNRHFKEETLTNLQTKKTQQDEESIEIIIKYYLLQLNNVILKEYDDMVEEALSNIRNFIKYQFVELKNPLVSMKNKHPIYTNYFTVRNKDKKNQIFANNGWIYGTTDPTINFASNKYMHYFTRGIIGWGDCIKLNFFGNSSANNVVNSMKEEDFKSEKNYELLINNCSKDLLEYMTEYVKTMAGIFDAFRLDNAHSTPIHIAEFLMNEARKVNPDLIVIAELFAGNEEREIQLVNRAGINLLIRECIHSNTLNDLAREIHYYGGGFEHVFGKLNNNFRIDSKEYIKLSGRKPKSIIYDMTHDNPTLHDKYKNALLSNSFLSVLMFSLSAIGSTKGFDELYFKNPSVVKENRKYRYLDSTKVTEVSQITSDEVTSENYDWKTPHFSAPKEIDYTFRFPKCNVTKSLALYLSSDWSLPIKIENIENDYYTKTIKVMPQYQNKLFFKFLVDDHIWSLDSNTPIDWDSNGTMNNVIDFNHRFSSLRILRKFLNEKVRVNLNDDYQIYLSQDAEKNTLSIFLYSLIDRKGFFLCHRSSYCNEPKPIDFSTTIPGDIDELLCYYYLRKAQKGDKSEIPETKENTFLTGSNNSSSFIIQEDIVTDFRFTNSPVQLKHKVNIEKSNVLHFKNLPFNSSLIATFKLNKEQIEAQEAITKLLSKSIEELDLILSDTNICDINYLLFSSEPEEHSRSNNSRGTYHVPNYMKFPFAGFENLFKLFRELRLHSPMDHALFENIRQGDWLLNYEIERLVNYPVFERLKDFLYLFFANYKVQPTFIKPHYFNELSIVLETIVNRKLQNLLFNSEKNSKLSGMICSVIDKEFVFGLKKASVQFIADLTPIDQLYKRTQVNVSISAGLPHFSSGFMRAWGRDTFIAFTGILLSNNQFEIANDILIKYAACLRHGQIPNLYDDGKNPRYNARDATWFFLKALIDYIEYTKNNGILNTEVEMIFLSDDKVEHEKEKSNGKTKKLKLVEIVVEIFLKHADGILFREWNAGAQIDENMVDEGFNVSVLMDKNTGFIHGGNQSNCGTWMDKMGSVPYLNKGVPASSRHGANVELNSMLYLALSYFDNLFSKQKEYDSLRTLKIGNLQIKLSDWANLIKINFEKEFLYQRKIPQPIKQEDEKKSKSSKSLSSFRSNGFKGENENEKKPETKDNFTYETITYYKDVLSNDSVQETRLRPNYIIALALTPELFVRENAVKAVETFEKYLLQNDCMGVKTLSSLDKDFNGDYNNSDNTHGFNYHNGPEWLWLMGYYLLAKNNFMPDNTKNIDSVVRDRLSIHKKHLEESAWNSLPELTNSRNSHCPGSCPSQAWSVGTILEALNKLGLD